MSKKGMQFGNLWLDKGNVVRVKYFHHEFIAVIEGFGRLGCTVKPDVQEPWMDEYLENQFDGIKEGHLIVDYQCITEVINHRK